jgi:hypothetical protein
MFEKYFYVVNNLMIPSLKYFSLAGLLVLPSSFDGEYPTAFSELFEARTSPQLKQLVREGHAMMQYVILHDKRSPSAKEDLA